MLAPDHQIEISVTPVRASLSQNTRGPYWSSLTLLTSLISDY